MAKILRDPLERYCQLKYKSSIELMATKHGLHSLTLKCTENHKWYKMNLNNR